jgi:hypothetical protein
MGWLRNMLRGKSGAVADWEGLLNEKVGKLDSHATFEPRGLESDLAVDALRPLDSLACSNAVAAPAIVGLFPRNCLAF